MPIKVEKKDGRLEDFDRNKISGSVVKSGVSPEEAESIAIQVETWVQGAALDGVVQASDIRTKVLELLQSIDPEATISFKTYKK